MTPNKEIMQSWIDALRSGEYKQGKYLLRDAEDNYCCFGVLADLYDKEIGTSQWEGPFTVEEREESGVESQRACYTHNGYQGVTSLRIEQWAGLHGDGQIIKGGTHYDRMNDEGASFEDIAKQIAHEVGIE